MKNMNARNAIVTLIVIRWIDVEISDSLDVS